MPGRWLVLGILLSGVVQARDVLPPEAAPSMEFLEFLGTFTNAEGEFVDPLLFHEETVPAVAEPVAQPVYREGAETPDDEGMDDTVKTGEEPES